MAERYDLIVVGAGAAGMMAAGTAAEQGLRVLLLDKNARPGRKLMITGKGRCNVTNRCGAAEFLESVCTNARFLTGAINRFPPERMIRFLEDHGVPLKTERGNRVFPVSDHASDIVDALADYVKRSGVSFSNETVRVIARENGCFSVQTDKGTRQGTNVLLATGGLSYPGTGSTGDGYRFARAFGHEIVETGPSLVPIETVEEDLFEMQGLSLRNVTLTVTKRSAKKPVYEELGEMLFTHFGVSGPLVLSASSHMRGDLGEYSMSVDLKPGLDREQLDARLLRDFSEYSNKDFINALSDLLPQKLIPVLVRRSGIPAHQKVHQITKAQRESLLDQIKAFSFRPKRFRPVDEAIVTTGGVRVREIDPKTMQSKLVDGLFFAGEVMDVDAYTGGFNLQIAFATAVAAAQAVIERKKQENKTMISIAIDGPAGAGKSTMAKAIAKELEYIYVDTGALYRAVGCYALRCNVDTTDVEKVTELLPQIRVELKYLDKVQHVFLNGEDVSTEIRLPEMSMAASNVSAIPSVRSFLFDLQQNMAKENNVVMDGRDIGTVVLPNAQIKIFLTASAEERAKRRMLEYEAKGQKVDFEALLAEVKQRDYNDSHRAIAPLKKAVDAVEVDTTEMDSQQTQEYLLNLVKERLKQL